METFKILTVCTGNIARSPLAQGLLVKLLPEESFEVSSSGTRAHPGMTVPRQQLRHGERLKVEGLEEHEARKVTAEQVEEADLVLAMDKSHRKRLVRMVPSASTKVFTVREFAHLAPHLSQEEVEHHIRMTGHPLGGAVRAVAAKRGIAPPLRGEALDVIDPFGGSRRTYRRSVRELVPAVETVAAFLNGVVRLYADESAQVRNPRK